MTIKGLSQYGALVKEIKYLRQKIEELSETITVQGSAPEYPYTLQNHTSKGIPTTKQNTEILNKYCVAKIKAEQELDKLIDYISYIDDSQLRQILNLRFIDGYKWNTVADIIGGGNTEDSVKKTVYRHIERNQSCPTCPEIVC